MYFCISVFLWNQTKQIQVYRRLLYSTERRGWKSPDIFCTFVSCTFVFFVFLVYRQANSFVSLIDIMVKLSWEDNRYESTITMVWGKPQHHHILRSDLNFVNTIIIVQPFTGFLPIMTLNNDFNSWSKVRCCVFYLSHPRYVTSLAIFEKYAEF